MSTNATELMRVLVIREPEPRESGQAVELNASAKLHQLTNGKSFNAARELLAKFGAAPSNVLVDPSKIARINELAEFRRRALEGADTDPATLVKSVFGAEASALVDAAAWRDVSSKLGDSILVLKLAYAGGPRPLTQLVNAYLAMVAIERIAQGEAQDLKAIRVILGMPLRLQPPFVRNTEQVASAGPSEERKAAATERVIARVRDMVVHHEAIAEIDAAIDDLRRVPITGKNFTVAHAIADLPKVAVRGKSGGSVDADAAEPIASAYVARWASLRDKLSPGSASTGHLLASGRGLMLSSAAAESLSPNTRKLLKSLELNPTEDAIERLAGALSKKRALLEKARASSEATRTRKRPGFVQGIGIGSKPTAPTGYAAPPIVLPAGLTLPPGLHVDWGDLLVEAEWPGEPPPPAPEPDLGPSLLLPTGVGQLFVIKQQITGYRSAEVSHVENVLPGETRERVHRRLRQHEETATDEAVKETEEEKSLQTTLRSELEREVQSTIKRQFDYGASAQVSADYGKVEFTAAGQIQGSTATEIASKMAQKLASEVIETSRQRVIERIRTERTRRMLDEIEETNVHKFDGIKLTEPMNGVYQWIDKVYTNEIWSYGKRTMYEVVVPEPAAGLLAAATAPDASSPHLVDKPEPLTESPTTLEPAMVAILCARYGVTENIEVYPEPTLVSVAFTNASDDSAEDNFYAETKELEIPDGYELVEGWIAVRARGENQTPIIGVTVGTATHRFSTDNIENEGEKTPIPITFDFGLVKPIVKKLQVAVALDDYSSFAVSVVVRVSPSAAHLDKWRRGAFAAIRGAYDAKLSQWREYQAQLDFEKPEISEKLFGRNPETSRALVRQELQRSAVEIIRNTSLNFDLLRDPTTADGIPKLDFGSLANASPEILFLSQAFEWNNMTFVLYPYFFGRREGWPQKMLLVNVDQNLTEFLKAGAARVQVPVRPGFEAAVDHYMMTREPFFGQGMPHIGDALYLPYLDEARDAFGTTLGGKHREDLDFEVIVPTELVVARNGEKINTEGGTLPKWVRSNGRWVEDPA
jgi:hypothetical protein